MNQQLNPANWVDLYADQLYAYCLKRIDDTMLAEDLVQETFLNAWKAKDSFTGAASEKNWLYAILKNKLKDHFRSKQHQQQMATSTADFFDNNGNWQPSQQPQQWPSAFNQPAEHKEFYTVLDSCKNKLKEIQQHVFVLKYMEDYKAEEICDLLQISANNYWVIIHRAKLQIRKCIEKNWVNT
jgi:RNA polymerase sigma-70 factor (ECF subfamily)